MTPTQKSKDLAGQMLEKYGPLMRGADLYTALGFKTYAAFHRAREKDRIGVRIFAVPGRRGVFALTNDVTAWLLVQANESLEDRNRID